MGLGRCAKRMRDHSVLLSGRPCFPRVKGGSIERMRSNARLSASEGSIPTHGVCCTSACATARLVHIAAKRSAARTCRCSPAGWRRNS